MAAMLMHRPHGNCVTLALSEPLVYAPRLPPSASNDLLRQRRVILGAYEPHKQVVEWYATKYWQ